MDQILNRVDTIGATFAFSKSRCVTVSHWENNEVTLSTKSIHRHESLLRANSRLANSSLNVIP